MESRKIYSILLITKLRLLHSLLRYTGNFFNQNSKWRLMNFSVGKRGGKSVCKISHFNYSKKFFQLFFSLSTEQSIVFAAAKWNLANFLSDFVSSHNLQFVERKFLIIWIILYAIINKFGWVGLKRKFASIFTQLILQFILVVHILKFSN